MKGKNGRPLGPIKATHPVIKELVAACEKSGKTHAAIAREAGVSHAYITSLRTRSRQNPRLEHLSWVAELLGYEIKLVKKA